MFPVSGKGVSDSPLENYLIPYRPRKENSKNQKPECSKVNQEIQKYAKINLFFPKMRGNPPQRYFRLLFEYFFWSTLKNSGFDLTKKFSIFEFHGL